jgi:N-acetylglucosamine-6-phosphate deacetylase
VIELRGRVLVEGVLQKGRVLVQGEHVHAVELATDANVGDAERVIAPGFIDLHVHGFGGADPLVGLAGIAYAHAHAGTTSFQPTRFPREPRALGEDCEKLERARAALVRNAGARVLGFHLEGPFVNPAAAGALPPADLARPTREGLRAILGSATGSGRGVRTMTLAPELAGASELVSELVRAGVRVSLGHTRASAANARGGACRRSRRDAPVQCMSPLHHREAGMVGVALLRRSTRDHRRSRARGRDAFSRTCRARLSLCLVSDALEGAGTGCEVFHTHGRELRVRDGASWYRPADASGEERLAGSASSQLEMVRKLVARGVVGLADALMMASATPARALGIAHESGHIAPGARADLLVLEGRELALTRVLVGGHEIELGSASTTRARD